MEENTTKPYPTEPPESTGKAFLTHGMSRLDPAIRLVDRAREIELADETIKLQTNAKLDLILKQIRHLQDQAKTIIDQASLDAELHRIKCNFEKNIFQEIYLYDKNSNMEGSLYFSLLSPEDWGGKPPHIFKGSFRMLADRSFEKLRDI